MQDNQIEELQMILAQLQEEHEGMQQRASSRAGKRLPPLPGTSIPFNELDDGTGQEGEDGLGPAGPQTYSEGEN